MTADYLQSLNSIASLSRTEPYEAVVQRYIALIAQHPERVETYQSFALYACMAGQTATAHYVIDEALQVDMQCARSLYIKARIYDEELDPAHSIETYAQSLRLDPGNTKCLFHLSLAQLSAGDFEHGAVNYESRLSVESLAAVASKPRWDGRSADIKVLIWAEQGLGDEIMFARFLPCLRHHACRFTLQCDRRLISTFRHNHPGFEFIPRGDVAATLSHFDAQLPIGDLLRLFHAAIDEPRVREGMLQPVDRPDIAQSAGRRDDTKSIVGLSWLSMNADSGERRSVPLDALLGVFSPDRHVLVNLQYLAPPEHLQAIRQRGFQLVDSIDCFNDVEGLGSLIAHCDAVVSIDNSTLHFAGALGKKTFALIPRLPNWRWLLDTPKSYWYPSVDLIRQQQPFDWSAEFAVLRRRFERPA